MILRPKPPCPVFTSYVKTLTHYYNDYGSIFPLKKFTESLKKT